MSNIVTGKHPLAVMASMYVCHHGLDGMRKIAQILHLQLLKLAEGIKQLVSASMLSLRYAQS